MTPPVVFEGSILARGPVTGVGRAFLTTLAAYTEIAGGEVVLLLPAGAARPEIPGLRILPSAAGGLAKQIRLPWSLARLHPRLLHSPVSALPLGARCAMVATVHDLPWMNRAVPGEPRQLRARLSILAAARRAAAILVPSESTQRDLLAYATRPRARIHMVPHAVERPSEPTHERDLCGPFLVLGDDRRRKNHEGLRRAHRRAKAQDPDIPELHFLGPPGAYVTEREKYRRLRRSRALLHPSLFEGFGLPVLEAMAHGVPVLCSNRASLPEVAGDAALLVDPDDEQCMAEAIVRIHRDLELRDRLRRRGLERAAWFTPQRSAREWLRIHEEISN